MLGLAAQQTLGNLFAGMVLLTARPFQVGERVRLQAGAVGGFTEGIVSSLGLLYTTLARGEDRSMIPNSVVLAAVVVPLREPKGVDVRVRLSSGTRPSQVQAILASAISTETRPPGPDIMLEEIDGDQVVVRVQATPEHAADGAKLADEIIEALANVTGEHPVVTDGAQDGTAEHSVVPDSSHDGREAPERSHDGQESPDSSARRAGVAGALARRAGVAGALARRTGGAEQADGRLRRLRAASGSASRRSRRRPGRRPRGA